VRTPDELSARIAAYREGPSDLVYDFSQAVVQEYVPGELHDVCLLFNRGEPRAVLTQRRVLMYPRDGGVGVVNETTAERDLCEPAIALLRALDWHGPAQVEFKRDSRDGRPKLIEVNGRFWGTLDLSIRAGVNFPLLAARLAAAGEVEPAPPYRVGLRYWWPVP
jgi:predicted ATP-grasp superfamily ATP-dependent carboligase